MCDSTLWILLVFTQVRVLCSFQGSGQQDLIALDIPLLGPQAGFLIMMVMILISLIMLTFSLTKIGCWRKIWLILNLNSFQASRPKNSVKWVGALQSSLPHFRGLYFVVVWLSYAGCFRALVLLLLFLSFISIARFNSAHFYKNFLRQSRTSYISKIYCNSIESNN